MTLKGPYKTLGEARAAVVSTSGCLTAFVDPTDGMIYMIEDPDPQSIEEIVEHIFMAFETLERRRSE